MSNLLKRVYTVNKDERVIDYNDLIKKKLEAIMESKHAAVDTDGFVSGLNADVVEELISNDSSEELIQDSGADSDQSAAALENANAEAARIIEDARLQAEQIVSEANRLAIIQALMVKVGEEKYAIALGSIETIEDVPVSEIKYVHAKEVINLRGNVIPLIRLRELLDVPGEPEESDNIVIVIVRKGDKLAGLVVDNLIGQMEIVIKSLGKYININRMISGATILGDGSVALIIDANTLV